MAIAFVKNGGNASTKTGGTTAVSATVPAGGHAAGNLVLVAVSWAQSGSGSLSVSDTRGNTYTVLKSLSVTYSGAIYASILTTALLAGDTITVNIGAPGVGSVLAFGTAEFSGASKTQDFTAATASTATTTPSIGPATPSATGTLFVGFCALNGPVGDTYSNDTDTTDGSWTLLTHFGSSGGGATSNGSGGWSYKISSGTSAQTYNPTLSNGRTQSDIMVGLQPAASGVTNNLTLSATQGQTATVSMAITRSVILSATQASSAAIQRLVSAIRSPTQAQSVTLPRAITKKVPTLTQAQSATVPKLVSKLMPSLAQSQTATLVRGLFKNITLAVSQPQASTLSRQTSKPLTPTQGQVVTLPRRTFWNRAVAQGQTASATKQAVKTWLATQPQSATLSKGLAKFLTLAASQASNAVVSRRTSKSLSATQGQSPTLARAIAWTRSLTQAQAPGLARQTRKGLASTQAQALTGAKQVNATRAATQGMNATIKRGISKTWSVAQAQTASLARQFISAGGTVFQLTLSAGQSTSASVSRAVGKLLSPLQGSTASQSKQTAKNLAASTVVQSFLDALKALPVFNPVGWVHAQVSSIVTLVRGGTPTVGPHASADPSHPDVTAEGSVRPHGQGDPNP